MALAIPQKYEALANQLPKKQMWLSGLNPDIIARRKGLWALNALLNYVAQYMCIDAVSFSRPHSPFPHL